jgi:tetratricopeptide (TPR) repeat protein
MTSISDLLTQAEQYRAAGRLVEGEAFCRRALEAQPNEPNALHMLGIIAHQSGKLGEAIGHIKRAIKAAPNVALFQANLGEMCRLAGRIDQAVAAGRRAVKLQANYPEALSNLGAALYERKDYAEAAECQRRAIALRPDFALAHSNLGNALHALKRFDEAIAAYQRAVTLAPNFADAWSNLGIIAHQSGKLDEAIGHIERAIKAAPDVALFQANLAETCRLAGRIDQAVAAGRRAVELQANDPEALSTLGAALYERKDYAEAAECHRRAIALRPDLALAHNNLGNALYPLKRFDEAIAAYQRAVMLAPDFADAWSNLGTTLHHAGRYDEGMAALRRAIALAPHHANAHTGLGLLLLMRGDFGEGWDEYEWRLLSSDVKGPRFPQRPWRGESLAGKVIYVQAEQGFGDTLQFARYLPMLATRAAKVSFRMHQSLLTLMRENLPGIELYGDRGTPAPADCEVALLSLPRLFKTRLETIPAQVAYLRAPADAAARWRARLAALPGRKVGLVWAGRPEHANDHRRSLDLATLAPLCALPGVSFVSLQVGPHAADVAKHPALKITDLAPQLTDFAETAGAVDALDLVITVDTAVAHLAGAMGKPVWVLLPRVPDFRWLLDRATSPWYPSARLFRKGQTDTWDDVIAGMAWELAARAASSTTAREQPGPI